MNSRNQSLDVLRGVAVLLVLCNHVSGNGFLWRIGWTGVDIFFVISGFLISGLLFTEFEEHGSIDVKRFLVRRAFKIYPGYYALILCTAIFFLVGWHKIPSALLWDSLFLTGYMPHIWDHGWSLAIEEHFYLTLPFLFLLLMRNRGRAFKLIPIISIVSVILCLYLRIKIGVHTSDVYVMLLRTHVRFDGLLCGVALGYYAHLDKESFRESDRIGVLIAGVLTLMFAFLLPNAIAVTFVILAAACLVAWSAHRDGRSRNPVIRALAWIGLYSYSIYLWHLPVALLSYRLPTGPWIFIGYMTVSVFLGVAIAKLIELPALRMRDRLFPSKRRRRTIELPSHHEINPEFVAEVTG
jgi:peptidoglycan/LPS O-acetylase OafA/YrhL